MRNWEDYSINDNVSYINSLLDEGLTMKEIEEKHYNVVERVIVKRLARRGYKRTKEGNRLFMLVDMQKANIKPIKAKSKGVEEKLPSKYKSNELLNNYNSNIDMQKLKELIEMLEPLKALLQKSELENNIIDVSAEELKVVKVEVPKVRSFKIDSNTLDKWDKFTKENNIYSVMDLVNSALVEYIEKYSKR